MTAPSPALSATTLNRRALARKALRRAATLAHQGQVADVEIADITGEGAGLLSARPIPPGRRGDLSFSLPLAGGDRPVTVPIRVMHSSYVARASFRIGVSFVAVDAGTAEAIQAYVDD
jgi:hypothetical protein